MFKLSNENLLFNILENQIDNLGRYNYHGNLDQNKFTRLYKESGDMTYHTGILLQFLPFRYFWINDFQGKQRTLKIIELILKKYLDIVSIEGLPRREIALDEEYQRFLPIEKNCDTGALFGIDSGICNKWVKKDKYWVRYDVSLDALSSLIVGLYYTHRILNDFRGIIDGILNNWYSFYKENNFMVRDLENRKPARFGNHNPKIIPLGYLVMQLLCYMTDKPMINYSWMNFIIENLRTYITGVFLDKKSRYAYNGYMFMMVLDALLDFEKYYKIKRSKTNYLKGIKNLLNEAKGEENLYFYIKAKKYGLDYPLIYIKEGQDLYAYSNQGLYVNGRVGYITSLAHRKNINRWESSAYFISFEKVADLYYCNEDLLKVYWQSYWQ
jgi:hypothetical protein